MKLKLISKHPETSDSVSFRFEPSEAVTWKAGQFMEYVLPHAPADDRKDQRWFTISTAPYERELQITTRFNPKGSSFKKALHSLEPGDEITATGPDGSFVVDEPPVPAVFIAGGIGITPFQSILKELDHRGQPLPFTLLYGNRTDEFVFKGEIEELGAKHPELGVHYFVAPQVIDEAALRQYVPNLASSLFYVSGPEPMVEAFEALLQKLGVPEKQIRTDHFPGYTTAEAGN